MSNRTIDKYQDILDSRDIIERIEELEAERAELAESTASEDSGDELVDWDEENGEELKALKSLQDEAEGYCPDWKYGATLIRDSYFETYAQELADDIGAINADLSWPNNCIDWERAARELQMDYTSVEFDGVTYWVR